MFNSAEGVLWIVDPNLRIGPVRTLAESLGESRVTEVRILSRDPLTGERLEEYRAIAAAIESSGRQLEWRTSAEPMFHDRWLADDGVCISIGGPFDNIANHPNPPYGQNIASRRPSGLDRWWERSSAL
ncbi:MAG: hypothetical protein OXC71_08735 [Chloroflexi bacterium]|nr:hypothetical protein [Chloroflexota bacterium]